MNKSFDLNFKYKGGRTYVHGTDIIADVLEHLSKIGFDGIQSVQCSFYKIVHQGLHAEIFENGVEVAREHMAAMLTFEQNGKTYMVPMMENGQPVTGSYDYAESAINETAVVNEEQKTIVLSEPLAFTPIEKIVALNKQLLSRLFAEEQGKWYFGKLDMSLNPANLAADTKYELCLVRDIGVKFTKTEIRIDGMPVGFIYFSMKKPA